MNANRRIVAFSGGLGSFEVARLLFAQYGVSAVELVFTDTNTEDEDLYRFIYDILDHFAAYESFTRLSDGRNIWQVFKDVKFQGNSRIDPCSRILKREIFAKYLENADSQRTTLYYGIQKHEKHRLTALVNRWAPFKVQAPLIALETTKEQILMTLDTLNIAPPRLYELGFEHNNCGGFCVKTGQRQMEHLLKVMPERYAWHEKQQEELFQIIEPHGFIRRTTDGELTYLSLKQFRELVEAKQPIQRFEDGACACFS